MREIKFQIYWISGHEMLYDTNNDLEFRDKENYWITDLSDARNHPERYKVRQYTGLKDEYDIEIYEGDIVEIAEQPLLRFEIVYSTEHAAFMRRWLSSLVSVTRECGTEEHIPPNTTFWKVIGNRYENPELLQ